MAVLAVLFLGGTAAWSTRAALFRGAADLWIVSAPLEKADAIVVLGGGVDTRPFAAADLYKRGYAPRILVADVRLGAAERLELLPSHSNFNHTVLIKLGVPPDAIEPFGQEVSNTYEEARALFEWAARVRAKRVIIPTSAFSARRTRWLFERELASLGVGVVVQALPPRDYSLDEWWRNERGVVEFQNEVIKYLYYRAKY